MKSCLLVLMMMFSLLVQAQPKAKNQKYPSLLWEITGNGLKKPSYLFGTMHVSSKIAFHLADSFYLGIRNADVVALETNPESWQEDMSKYEMGNSPYSAFARSGGWLSVPADYLGINTLKFYKYDKKIERSLYSSPSSINNLLYRSYGNESSDFEEDTYLDMYIYQCGKKWGKKVAGVEKYAESMKLMQEAYRDAARDKNKKDKNYDVDEEYAPNKLQEAYRKGNLDQLDSINRLNSFSDAFDEKFLYKRNEIQANSIDSILKSKYSLFVGVGAAHLPGRRGVIEMLRDKGYRLRPMMMGERDSRHKDQVEKVRVPVTFNTETSEDGFFKVNIPGKFYKFGDDGALEQQQYADMANGSYYMVTRIMTNGWMWGDSPDIIYKRIDSLLYENIPGKIISKTRIVRNGYNGFDILNRTRRGDMQRYNIFITPFEIIFFKMSGTGDYVKNGDEASKFFGSIQFSEYKQVTQWQKYSPGFGGFSIDFPHQPYVGNDGSWIYDAEDKTTATQYRVIRSDIHNYHFVEEDSFDLGLLDESFSSSDFIEKQLSRKQTTFKGYPALDCRYLEKNGGIYLVRFLIQGPHYYTIIAHGKKEIPAMQAFLNSFEIKPFLYKEALNRRDSVLYYSVKSPVFPELKKEKLDIPRSNYYGNDEEEDDSEADMLESGAYRSKIISNDSTGEKVYVSFYKASRYFFRKDSIDQEKDDFTWMGDSTWVVKSKKRYELPNHIKVFEIKVSDTGSSRMLWSKRFYRDGIGFSVMTEIDTLSQPSSFINSFFDSFTPADTLKGIDIYAKKSTLFFQDFASKDSIAHKRALKSMESVTLDSSDLPQLKKTINSLSFSEKKYLETKKTLIHKIEDIRTRAGSDYLKELYYAAGDTIELQYTALETLLQQQTAYSFRQFRDIVVAEPPVIEGAQNRSWDYSYLLRTGRNNRATTYNNGGFLDDLNDTLELTRTILPELLSLLNLDDYKRPLMGLLAQMVDSNLVQPKDYQQYFSKFLIEAKQAMKKQAIAEKKKAIEKAEEKKVEKNNNTRPDIDEETRDKGNDDLVLYATLLVPFWETQTAVPAIMQQMLASNDKQLKYNAMLLLMRNKRPYPDSLPTYFAAMDDYRYRLYSDLKAISKLNLFPKKFNTHLDLGRSKLMEKKSYDRPDTLAYVNRYLVDFKGRKGYIYFFKYKSKQEDMNWKLATVGLTPEDPGNFEFDNVEMGEPGLSYQLYGFSDKVSYNFTNLTDTKLDPNITTGEQLAKELRKLLYSRRKSAKEFYGSDADSDRFDLGSIRADYRD